MDELDETFDTIKNEVHHILTSKEMDEIFEFRAKLAYKSLDQTYKLLYEWTKTGHITFRQHHLLAIYIYSN